MPIVRVGGDTLKFPDSMSQEEIKAVLDKRYGAPTGDAGTPPSPTTTLDAQRASQLPVEPREPDLIDRMGSAVAGGFQGAKEAFTQQGEGEITDPTALGTSPAERTQEALSSVLGGLGEAGGEVLGAAYDTFAPPSVKEFVSEVGEDIMGLEPVQDAVAYAKEFAEEQPGITERAGDVANLSALVAPKARLTTRTDVTKPLRKLNEPYVANKRTQMVEEMLVDKDVADFELSARGAKEYEVPQWTQEVAEEVKNVKGLSPSRSASHNQAVLRKEATKVRDKMEAAIRRRGNPRVDVATLKADMAALVDQIPDMPESFVLSGDAQQKAQKMLQKFIADVDASDGTALGVLNARRDFDRWVRKQSNSKVYDPETTSAVSFANKLLRDKVNDSVDGSVSGVSLRNSLDKQHKLLTAQDTLMNKARKEREGVAGRLIQKVEDATSLHMPTTPVAVAAIPAGAAAFAAGAPAAAATMAAALAAYGGYKGARWLGGPNGRRWALNVIRTIERDPFLSKKYKADRLALLDIINSPQPEEEEDF